MLTLSSEQLNKELDSRLWPVFESVVGDSNQMELGIRVQNSLSYFTGHFPEQAVLPGVVQIHWVGELARKAFSTKTFLQIKSVKFNEVILPETHLLLSLNYTAESGRIRFSYSNSEHKFSSGIMEFEGV